MAVMNAGSSSCARYAREDLVGVARVAGLEPDPLGGEPEAVRVGADQPLREWCRLREERPVPVAEGERGVGAAPHLTRGHDVQHGEARDDVGTVERHPVGDARAAVVSGDRERVEAERAHRGDEVGGQRALGVGAVVFRDGRAERVTVSGQIGGDDREPLRQQGATGCHIRCVSGYPCTNSSGGPSPPTRA